MKQGDYTIINGKNLNPKIDDRKAVEMIAMFTIYDEEVNRLPEKQSR